MSRRNEHLDSMLRHLGAAYYESLHGRASASDVARALGSVEEHVGEPSAAVKPAQPTAATEPAAGVAQRSQVGRWHRRVRDVMTTSVVSVDRITPYKEIAALLAEHQVSALPVLMMGRRVAGVVSEADLLRLEDQRERSARASGRNRHLWRGRSPHWGLTAGELMTAPAVTIHPDATLPAAARLMNQHHVRRLPVVDPAGALIGIVSRRDLLSVFLRPDDDIAADVRAVFTDVLLADPATVTVTVKAGVVTLAGEPKPLEQPGLISVAVRLTWEIDGVVDVVNDLVVTNES
ncbi:MAG: CBS domain-containing protein [Micromonosporaceae bacterium]